MHARLASSSFALATLVVTQLVSLMSVLAWGAIAAMLVRAGRPLDAAGAVFAVYPAFPVALSLLAWFAFRLRRYPVAIILSSLPAVVAFVLMAYYYAVGLMNHAS
ncbi:MAG: hypothetical protein ACKOB6_09805 [Candidatus Kapaibacterium sp.]